MQPKTIYLKDYQPSDFLIDTVHLYVDLHEEFTRVKSILTLSRNPKGNPNAPLILDGDDLALKNVALDGKVLNDSDYRITDVSLILTEVPNAFTLETEVIIHPEKNTKLSGLYRSRGNYCTQCEPHGFRRITYFIDRPDVMARYTTTITADKAQYPILLSNGNLIESKDLGDGRHWVHWEDPSKKPSYLFALVAGNFDHLSDQFVTLSGKPVVLNVYLEKGFKDQGAFALEALKRAMRWDEETFGREYDLDIYMIVAVSDFNVGAMENKGLNIFNTKYILANEQTATDADYVAIENVIGHEYFHNWSGNRITCRDWFQITLKEGLTVLRDQLFLEDMTSEAVARINEVNRLRNGQFAEDAGPMAHPIRPHSYIEVNNFYTNTVYQKGAEVLRMVRTFLGKDTFRKGMDLYFSRYDGQAVTTEDFIQAMEEASHKDLSQFKRWYDQSGTPILDVTGTYDETQKSYTLNVKQSCPSTPLQPHKEPFQLPLSLGFINGEGQPLLLQLSTEETPTETKVLEIAKTEEQFTFINIPQKPIPSLLRGFSAPIILHFPYSNEELLKLLERDTDYFSRWEAGQELTKRLILNLAEDYRSNKKTFENPKWDDRLIHVYRKILVQEASDPFYNSLLMALPTEQYLLQVATVSDVEGIHDAREFIQKQIAEMLMSEFKACYQNNQLPHYQFNTRDMGKRQLKNQCLDYLTKNDDKAYIQLAYSQFNHSDNMTDTVGALTALNDCSCEERQQALNAFYERWKQQPLVINKWFLLQAQSSLKNTLQTVKELIHHSAFNIKNPNNVYALIGGFSNNVIRFHDSSGEGYAFLADQVLNIDAINPQVAARILQPLSQWQKMDEHRQELMKQQLQRIMQAPGLSKNVFEIATKSLG